MAMKVKAVEKLLKFDKNSAGVYRYVMSPEMYSSLNQKKVIKESALRSGVSQGVMQACWDAAGEVIKAWATEGHSVALLGLGTMRFGLRSKSVEDVNKVKTNLITSRRIIFTPDTDLKDELKNTSVVITCYDRDGKEVKRVTSSDDAEVEDPEQEGNGTTENGGNGSNTNDTNGTNFVWAVTTCGDNTGKTMDILNRELSKKGLKAETLFSVIMPESYVCLPFMYTDTESREREKIEQARQQTEGIARIIKERKRGIEQLNQGATPRLFSYVIGQYFNKHMITDKKFTVDIDICTRCGKCQRVCPVDNITGTSPRWLHNGQCTCCLACYHYCPVHAINYGSITRKRDQYYFNRREDQK